MIYKLQNGKQMPSNEIRLGESIADWKRRITKQNATPEINGGQIVPSVIVTSPQTKKGRYLMEKKLRPTIGRLMSDEALQHIRDFEDAINNTSMIITNPEVAVTLADAADVLPNPEGDVRLSQYNNAKQTYLDSIHQGNDLFSQLYRWARRKIPHKQIIKEDSFGGTGADIISLNDNVVRLTPDSKQATALANEFVEKRHPSVLTAAEYKSDPNRIIGDKFKFPVSDINYFAGIEDGKFRLDELNNFKDNTVIIPARNIKKDVPEIYGIKIDAIGNNGGTVHNTGYSSTIRHRIIDNSLYGTDNVSYPWKNNDRLFRAYLRQKGIDEKQYEKAIDDALMSEMPDETLYDKAIRDWKVNYGYKNNIYHEVDGSHSYQHTILKPVPDKLDEESTETLKRNYPLIQFAKDVENFNKGVPYGNALNPNYLALSKENENKYGFIDRDGNLHSISEYNADVLDGKTILGNQNGSIFIGRIQDISKPQLDSLNNYLSNNPSRILRLDLGSYNLYNLDHPSLDKYLGQYVEHPKVDDPNVYVIGTSKPNKLWYKK